MLSGDRLYTVDSPFDVRGDVTSWSSTRFAGTGPSRPGESHRRRGPDPGRTLLAPVDGVLLLQGESFATSILDPETGAVLWTTPGWPSPLGAGRVLVQESQFRPGTEYDLKSGDPGELFWSSSGRPHTEPPLRTTVSRHRPGSGRRLVRRRRGSVRMVPVPGDAGQVVVAASDQLILRAARTGEVLRRAAVRPAAAPRRSGPPAG